MLQVRFVRSEGCYSAEPWAAAAGVTTEFMHFLRLAAVGHPLAAASQQHLVEAPRRPQQPHVMVMAISSEYAAISVNPPVARSTQRSGSHCTRMVSLPA